MRFLCEQIIDCGKATRVNIETLVARRIIRDYILQLNGVTNIDIAHDMVLAAWSARAKYSQYLAQKKEQQEWEKR